MFSKIKTFLTLFVYAGKGFFQDGIPKLSASLAYFTLFSIVPLLTVIISIGSLVYQQEAVEGKLFVDLSQFMGNEIAIEIQKFVKNTTLSGKSSWALIIGLGSLLLGASAVFIEIQDSLNKIWRVQAEPKKGWLNIIINRIISFSMIATIGFIMLVSLMLNSVLTQLGGYLQNLLPDLNISYYVLLSEIFSISVIIGLFTLIFKMLPDVVMKWKTAFVGALVTTLLFGIGKYFIDFYLSTTNPGAVYGAAGSIIVMLIWVYYTAFILYYGAEFTQVYAEKFSDGIKPSKNAVYVKQVVEKKSLEVLPPQHPDFTQL